MITDPVFEASGSESFGELNPHLSNDSPLIDAAVDVLSPTMDLLTELPTDFDAIHRGAGLADPRILDESAEIGADEWKRDPTPTPSFTATETPTVTEYPTETTTPTFTHTVTETKNPTETPTLTITETLVDTLPPTATQATATHSPTTTETATVSTHGHPDSHRNIARPNGYAGRDSYRDDPDRDTFSNCNRYSYRRYGDAHCESDRNFADADRQRDSD